MSLDLEDDYKKAKDKISSIDAYKDLQKQYTNAQKRAGEALEYGGKTLDNAEAKIKTTIDKAKKETKRYQKEKKDQLGQLLDISTVTGSNSMRYIKTQMIKAIRNIQPKIKETLLEEIIKTTGCDQQQSYPAQTVYVKVKSVDLAGMLKLNPTTVAGKVLYEKKPVQVQDNPFSMNKELYNRVQNPDTPYSVSNTQDYIGKSSQNLFDITYTDNNNFGEYGPWFKVDLKNRTNNVNIVGEFLVDYFNTIEVVDFNSVMANIMNSLSGAVSLKVGASIDQVEDASKFERYLARILGLCFDNRNEIDVSGVAKVAELDGIDESFYELTDIDLRDVEQKISNFRLGVVEFLDCSTEKLPVNTEQILSSLSDLNKFEGPALDKAASELTDVLANNPEWIGLTIKGNIKASLDTNFIKLISQGLTLSLLGPKVLLPIFTMLKAIAAQICGEINGLVDFFLCFKDFVKNLISKIGALFIKELFQLIKRDIVNLIQSVIKDLQKEVANKKVIMILKLVQILLIVAKFVSDWRKCKSVIDEILALLKIATSGVSIPLPLLFASKFLDGFSATRSMIGTIEELQKLGIPTGPMPDGSPNLQILSMMGQTQAQVKEEAENGKVQIALPPLTITPAGLTIAQSAFGKKI